MENNHQNYDEPVEFENEHLKRYIAKKSKRNSRLRVGRKNKGIKKNRRNKMLKTILPILIIFGVVALIAGYFVSPLSKIQSVTLQATQNQHKLKNEVPIKTGDSLLMVKQHNAKIIEILQKVDPNIKAVKIVWKNHNQALVKIKFYDFHAYTKKGKKTFPVYINGHTEKQATKIDNSVNVVKLSDFDNSKQMKSCLEEYEKLPQNLKNKINEIKNEANTNDPQKIRIFLKDKNQIVVRSNELVKKLAYYPDIKTTLKRPSVINLEYGAYATPIK